MKIYSRSCTKQYIKENEVFSKQGDVTHQTMHITPDLGDVQYKDMISLTVRGDVYPLSKEP